MVGMEFPFQNNRADAKEAYRAASINLSRFIQMKLGEEIEAQGWIVG